MKIFLSHAGRDKPLVRELISFLPESVTTWLDEKDLPIGTSISQGIKAGITDNTDLVIFFVSRESVESQWVKRELEWSLERESQLGFTFIFPIVLELAAWNCIEPKEFHDRKYLLLNSFERKDIEAVSSKLKEEIINWLIRFKKEKDSSSSVISRFKLEINVRASHLLPASVVYRDPSIPSEHMVSVRFKTDTPETKINAPSNGKPMIEVELINKGEDIQIDDVVLKFNEYFDGMSIDSEIEKASALSLSSLSCNGIPSNRGFELRSNHKKEFHLRHKPFIKIILGRGIKAVVVTDVAGNQYYADNELIADAERYLKHFFSFDGIDAVYSEI